MSLLDSLFGKRLGPVFVKDASDTSDYIGKLKFLSSKASGSLKDKIEEQIRNAEAGLYGEKQIIYELKNSGLDMMIAHDLYLKKGELSAQIDFLVMTRKHLFVIECKNLYGDIEIDDKGNFIRHIRYGKTYKKEGLYSPITQNERHLNVLKEVRRLVKNNLLGKLFYDTAFPKCYRSIVVLANEKTVLNDKNAPKQIREQIIRADQLISYIKKVDSSDDNYESSDKEMEEVMFFYVNCSIPNQSDYAKKYEAMLEECSLSHSTSKMDEPMGDEKYIPPEIRESYKKDNTEKKTIVEKNEIKVNENKAQADENEKICPRCGSPMVFRTAKRGAHSGNQFWGCSNFPKCRFIIK
jgi:hypothetical protein